MSYRQPVGARLVRACALAIFLHSPGFTASALAACQINGVSDLGFGAYDVFSTLPNNNAIGRLIIRCTGGSSATVKLSSGLANSFAPRTLKSAGRALRYNLYTNAARTIVWGDGTGGTSVMAVGKNHTDSIDIFGSVPEGQDAAVGIYTDNIVVTVNF